MQPIVASDLNVKPLTISSVAINQESNMEPFHIQVDYQTNEEDTAVIAKGLGEFNTPFFGHKKSLSFALYLKDENHQVVGGILAWIRPGLHLLCIDTIWVAEHLRNRGWGKQLMQAAENEGLKNGCTHAQLETLPFQAEEFYKKLGYNRIGLIEKLYGNHDAIYLRKYLISLQDNKDK
jgi:ribosomal protein S18 acetylase RimI-like enzyme